MMSKAYASMSREELLSLKEELDKEFQGYKEKGLKLDMSRGKPSIAAAESFHGNDGCFSQRCLI